MRSTTDENGGEQDVNEELNGEICDPQSANLSPSTGDSWIPCPAFEGRIIPREYVIIGSIRIGVADWINSASIVFAVCRGEVGLRRRYRQVVREIVLSDAKVASIV